MPPVRWLTVPSSVVGWVAGLVKGLATINKNRKEAWELIQWLKPAAYYTGLGMLAGLVLTYLLVVPLVGFTMQKREPGERWGCVMLAVMVLMVVETFFAVREGSYDPKSSSGADLALEVLGYGVMALGAWTLGRGFLKPKDGAEG